MCIPLGSAVVFRQDSRVKGCLRSFSPEGLVAFERGVARASNIRRRQADEWALSLASDMKEILSKGYPGFEPIARELQERGCATRRGGKWSVTAARLLFHRLVALGVLPERSRLRPRPDVVAALVQDRRGVEASRRALREYADEFALSLAPAVDGLGRDGFRTHRALADELNRKGVLTRQGKRWKPHTVRELIKRIREAHTRNSIQGIHATEVSTT